MRWGWMWSGSPTACRVGATILPAHFRYTSCHILTTDSSLLTPDTGRAKNWWMPANALIIDQPSHIWQPAALQYQILGVLSSAVLVLCSTCRSDCALQQPTIMSRQFAAVSQPLCVAVQPEVGPSSSTSRMYRPPSKQCLAYP